MWVLIYEGEHTKQKTDTVQQTPFISCWSWYLCVFVYSFLLLLYKPLVLLHRVCEQSATNRCAGTYLRERISTGNVDADSYTETVANYIYVIVRGGLYTICVDVSTCFYASNIPGIGSSDAVAFGDAPHTVDVLPSVAESTRIDQK